MRVKWVICRRNCRHVVPDGVKVQTCWNCFFFSPFVKQGGSHSWSRSTFMNSSMVSWLVGVSPNSTSLTKEKSQQVKNHHTTNKVHTFEWEKVNDIKNIDYKSPFSQSLFTHFHNADDFFDGAAKVVHSSCNKKRWKQKQTTWRDLSNSFKRSGHLQLCFITVLENKLHELVSMLTHISATHRRLWLHAAVSSHSLDNVFKLKLWPYLRSIYTHMYTCTIETRTHTREWTHTRHVWFLGISARPPRGRSLQDRSSSAHTHKHSFKKELQQH